MESLTTHSGTVQTSGIRATHISRDVPSITSDCDLVTKTSILIHCRVISADLDLNCIVGAIRLVNSGMKTADKI